MNQLIEKVEIENLIYEIRGKQVMLDRDLAMLYQVETKRINEAVKRNSEKFPERFAFHISEEEFKTLKTQNATSSLDKSYSGRRYRPRVFTEQV